MMMGSSKWLVLLATTAIMVMVLVENALALKCHECTPTCQEEECTAGSTPVCKTTIYIDEPSYDNDKICDQVNVLDKILGGGDTCRTGTKEEFKKKELRNEFKNRNPGGKEEDYVKEKFESYQNTEAQGQDLSKKITVCSCSTELCNNDDDVKKLVEANKDKKLDSSFGAATTLMADSGNLGAVMFLALALLATFVPGFLRSQ